MARPSTPGGVEISSAATALSPPSAQDACCLSKSTTSAHWNPGARVGHGPRSCRCADSSTVGLASAYSGHTENCGLTDRHIECSHCENFFDEPTAFVVAPNWGMRSHSLGTRSHGLGTHSHGLGTRSHNLGMHSHGLRTRSYDCGMVAHHDGMHAHNV